MTQDKINIKGIILSGGPLSITKTHYLGIPKKILNFNIPILGICYGHQLLAKQLGGVVKNYKKIVQRLASNENTLIEVVGNMDSICFACPNKINESLCTTQSKITELDSRHQQILGLKIGEILSWKEAKAKIKKYMNIEKFEYSCDGCSWKEYGICQKALETLLKED